MPTKAILTALLLLSAAPASAECVYKNVYDHLNDQYVTVPFSCPPVKASEAPKFRSWNECPVHEERDATNGTVYRVRTCA